MWICWLALGFDQLILMSAAFWLQSTLLTSFSYAHLSPWTGEVISPWEGHVRDRRWATKSTWRTWKKKKKGSSAKRQSQRSSDRETSRKTRSARIWRWSPKGPFAEKFLKPTRAASPARACNSLPRSQIWGGKSKNMILNRKKIKNWKFKKNIYIWKKKELIKKSQIFQPRPLPLYTGLSGFYLPTVSRMF